MPSSSLPRNSWSKTSSSLPRHNNDFGENVLDLHGLKKEHAIAKLTFFLDQVRLREHGNHKVMVTIITGSGKHSLHGPVLRQAVHSTLNKRQMEFNLNFGKGSFSVNAMSGIDLYADDIQRQDSKVVVVPNHHHNLSTSSLRLIRQQQHKLLAKDRSCSTSLQISSPNFPNPLPSEVAADDKLVQKVKKLSVDESSRVHSEMTKDRNQLEQARLLSMECKKKTQEEEEEELKMIIAASREEKEEADRKEEEELREVLQMSLAASYEKVEVVNRKEEEEQQLRKALEMSLFAKDNYGGNISSSDHDNFHEDIKRAIEQSRMGMNNIGFGSEEDSEFDRAMQESIEKS